jgi:protein-L-isoaspartate(D-aspartate) O-methyltransferase
MTEALELRAGERVLEVGTGSGYQAAVLARLVAEVWSIEINPELSARAAGLLRRLGYANVRTRAGDGFWGWPEAGPFDAVMVTAATPRMPERLVAQLAEGGRIIAPVGDDRLQTLVLGRKVGGSLVETRLLPVMFVPMTGVVRAPTP